MEVIEVIIEFKEIVINDSTDNLEKFIDDEFYVTIINRIKSEENCYIPH